MLNVRRMKPFGHELLCVLADEFFARISKELFGLRVDKLNMSRTVDNHHRVGRGFEQVSKLFLFSDALRNVAVAFENRSEERRVGKECRSRWSPYYEKKKINVVILSA